MERVSGTVMEDVAECRIPEQFLDQVDMGHEHTATAVARQAELVHSVTITACQKVV